MRAGVASEEVEPLAIPAGSGERLGDIPNVERRLAMTNGNAAELKKLHRIMFPGGRPLKATIKKQIRQFRGWEVPADEASFQREKLKQLVELDGKAVLKPLCQLLDVEISGTKASMAERIYSFLCKPSSSGKAFRTKKVGLRGLVPGRCVPSGPFRANSGVWIVAPTMVS